MNRTGGISRWLVAVVVLVGLMLAWWLLNPNPKPEPPPYAANWNDCQQDRLIIRTEGHDSVTGADLPLIGPIADLPEFHDCQRFVIVAGTAATASAPSQDSLAFGPLVAIWAANQLDGAFVRKGEQSGKAVPVAIIYTLDPTKDYPPLGIERGFSCLYLWNDGQWNARMVSLGLEWDKAASPPKCLNPVEPIDRALRGGTTLQVRPATLDASLKPSDIPPVARWDWDTANSQQFIGIRCGDEWCDIGKPGFVPSEPAAGRPEAAQFLAALKPIPVPGVPQATPTEVLRTVAVKGWYDSQRLDFRPTEDPNKGVLTMSDASGVVFPQPALGSVDSSKYRRAWIPSAYAVLDRPYKEGKIPMEAGVNRVEICLGSASDCEVPPNAAHCDGIDRDSSYGWWGRVISASGTPYYYCVKRRDHGGEIIPVAASRWNWSEADAKTWTQCGQACCTGN